MLGQYLATFACCLVCFVFVLVAGYAKHGGRNWVYNNEDFLKRIELSKYKVGSSLLLPNDTADQKKLEKLGRGDKAKVMYKMYLKSADSGFNRCVFSGKLTKAFEVILGSGKVIKGFDEALHNMCW